MRRKKSPPGLDDLYTPIIWDESFGNEKDWYDNFYVQLQLGLKLNALFKHYGIELSNDQYAQCRLTFFRLMRGKVSDPFHHLLAVLALDRFRGFRVLPRSTNVGRPREDRYSIANMLLLGKRISDGIQNSKSASWVISRVVKEERSPFYGTKKATLERRWKIFKNTETVTGETYGQALSIPMSREQKQPVKKKIVKQTGSQNIKQAVLSRMQQVKARLTQQNNL